MTLLGPARSSAVLGRRLADGGEHPALVGPDGEITYAELAERVDEVAARLGPVPRLVLLPMANALDPVVAYLGALAGGHPVLLTDDDPLRQAELVARFDPDVVADATDGIELHERRSGTRHELHPDLALLLSTSGSTGSPRLVRLSHANLRANAAAIATFLDLRPDDRAITSLPLHYCYGLSLLHSHLVAGGSTVLTDRSVVDACFWDAFRRHGATTLAGVPYTFELLERAGFRDLHLPSLRRVTQAGGRLAPERVVRLAQQGAAQGWDLFVMYGQTEATARMAYLPPSLARAHPEAIGQAIPGGALRLEPTDVVDDPEVGELVYEGPNVMLGYATDPAELALGPTLDELRTGDLARCNDRGLFEIVGRRARFAKVCGLRLDLERVEASLHGAGVGSICASDDERVVVAVSEGAQLERAVEIVQSATSLPRGRVVGLVASPLPRLANGKPDHQEVLARAAQAEPLVPASTSGAEAVRDVLARVLGVPEVGDEDTFVSLGGDSLSYVEASIRLESVLGDLPEDWTRVPVGALTAAPRRSRWWSRVETSAVLRAMGIVLVVGTHIKLFSLLGGAHLMLVMAGASYGRFQSGTAGRVRSIARIAVPSVAWLALATQLDDRIRLPHVLQLNGWIGADDAHGGYWFVEALLQILVPLTLLLAVPAIRRVEQADRFRFALGALGVGLLVRFRAIDLPTEAPRDIRPQDIFWIFALGWAAAHVRTTSHRVLLSLVAVASFPGYFGEPQREVLLVAGTLLLLWVPTLPVPRIAVRPLGLVAGASLFIYLSHWQVFPPVREGFGKGAAMVVALVAGVCLWQLAQTVERTGRGVLARRRADPQGSPATGVCSSKPIAGGPA